MPEKKSSAKKNFDAQLAALDALREQPDEACIAPLRAALQHQNNYTVSKAADQVAQRRLEPLLPDLVAATTASSNIPRSAILSAGQRTPSAARSQGLSCRIPLHSCVA